MNKTYCDRCGKETKVSYWSKFKFEINNNTDNNAFETELCPPCHRWFKESVIALGQGKARWTNPIELSSHEYYGEGYK